MHSHDPNKSVAEFQQEVVKILHNSSAFCSQKDRFDFTRFVFPECSFRDATFTQITFFIGATFTQDADFNGATFNRDSHFRKAKFAEGAYFIGATFTQDAKFDGVTFTLGAYFVVATFTRNADFSTAAFIRDACFHQARFAQDADFRWAKFSEKALFDLACFGAIADFRGASFELPSRVLFNRVNEGSPSGMRARFVNCLLEGVRFEDVHWYSEGGRLTLQDEIDLCTKIERATHELVSNAYRRLVNNFEKARQYELAEQSVIGEMEMRRLNPRNFILGRKEEIAVFYMNNSVARWFGERLSVANLYRLLSIYGSSYKRALAVLIVFLLAFALSFSVSGLRPAKESDLKPQCSSAVPGSPEAAVISWGCAAAHPNLARELWGTFKSGAWASIETATFQRARVVEPATGWGRALAVAEIIVVPGQLALVLLALRRRFRR